MANPIAIDPDELRAAILRMTVVGYDDVGEWRFVPESREVADEIRRLAIKALDDEERAGEQLALLR